MTDFSSDNPNSQPINVDVDGLLLSLRRKEGSWVEWGQACQTLQKAGLSSQKIFEETGFEPIHQNQVIVAAQVYISMVNAGVSEQVRSHYEKTGSDSLYEFRILTQPERAAAATFTLTHQLNSEDAKEVAKAIKDFSRLRVPPAGFGNHAGDAMAYHYWRLARQQSDLQERSRLIAKGLRFAHTDAARQQVEKLLIDFTVTPKRPAPILPFYRLETEEQMPRLLPIVGKMPVSVMDLKAVPLVEEIGPFRMVQFSGQGAWVAVPGWQVLLKAEDPVAVLCDRSLLPNQDSSYQEEVLVVIDRSQREWDDSSYFAFAQGEDLQFQWFEESPEETLLGKLILILNPKRILDEDLTKDVWQIDE
ncbi:RuBisCO accumulation factor 1 [Aerosakkonemataceae cyanobacterium BLCC-F154]|uniref:RuBisCO accumulation factor 1 n=1 Tax=Floridaenema fluviatile BLCC-F154 TaxID=3153640 RepID=A0ABV4YG34_9CYAN